MLNVLIEGMTNNKGGKETYIINMYNALDKKKYKFTFVAYDDVIAYEDYLLKTGAEVIHIPARNLGLHRHKKALNDLMMNNNFDVIWSHKTTLSACEIMMIGKKNNVPLRMIHSHSSANMGNSFTLLMHNINKKFIFKWANRYLACSKTAAKWFFGEYSAVIMKNGIDLEKFKFDETIRNRVRHELNLDGKFVIGHVGRFGIEKNHKKLISIINECRLQNENIRLVLCGDGEERENIVEQIRSLKLEKYVVMLGVVDNVNEILQAVDIIVMPSLFEGLPFALLEAQTAGLKCIVSDTVSRESDILKWNQYIPLEEPDKVWKEKIFEQNINYNRIIGYDEMKKKNYDIKDCVTEFEVQLEGKARG